MSDKKVKPSHLILLVIFVLSAVGLRLWQFRWPTAVVAIGGEELHVLVANTPANWHKGLGGRESLGRYDGMLFLFPAPAETGIVMRDMLFPLDIVWLDRGEVIDIAPNVAIEPGSPEASLKAYYPRKAGNMVLELPAGWVAAHGLKIGDRLTVIEG